MPVGVVGSGNGLHTPSGRERERETNLDMANPILGL